MDEGWMDRGREATRLLAERKQVSYPVKPLNVTNIGWDKRVSVVFQFKGASCSTEKVESTHYLLWGGGFIEKPNGSLLQNAFLAR